MTGEHSCTYKQSFKLIIVTTVKTRQIIRKKSITDERAKHQEVNQ